MPAFAREAGDTFGPVVTRQDAAKAGVFTGEYTSGLPVYRLPPVSVTASRASALPRVERDERVTREARTTTRPQVRPAA